MVPSRDTRGSHHDYPKFAAGTRTESPPTTHTEIPMKNTIYALLLLCATSAFGWNCTAPGQVRVQVPTGTVGSGTGDGSGQVVVDNGLTFECETLPTTGGSGSSATATSTNNNTNSNTNNNNLSQHQKQSQSQSQSQSNTSENQSAGGSVSNVGNSITNVAAPDIPVTSAYAPPVFSTTNCFKGYSAGAQTPLVGGSFGGGGIDKNCAAERVAQDYYAMGNRLAACKVEITTKASKAAGVTLADCLNVPVSVPRPIIVAPSVPAAAPVTVNT